MPGTLKSSLGSGHRSKRTHTRFMTRFRERFSVGLNSVANTSSCKPKQLKAAFECLRHPVRCVKHSSVPIELFTEEAGTNMVGLCSTTLSRTLLSTKAHIDR